MKRYQIRLTDQAELDLAQIYSFIRKKSASSIVARNFVNRIKTFVSGFETHPERGISGRDCVLSALSAG